MGEGIDSSRITAHYDNGVLSLVIPVSGRAKPRKIEVVSGQAHEPVDAIDASPARDTAS